MEAPAVAYRASGMEVNMPAHEAAGDISLRERAKRTETVFTPREPNRVFPAFCFLWSEKIPTLGHNLALISVLYSVNGQK